MRTCLLINMKDKASTVLLKGVLRRSEFPKMQEDTATWQLLINLTSSSVISNPVLGEPVGPLTNPQFIVWSWAINDISLSSKV